MATIQQFTNYHFAASIAIKGDKEAVWGLLTDVSKWSEWDTELRDSRISGDFALNASGTLTPKTGPKLRFEIIELQVGSFYTFRTRMPVGYLVIRRALTIREDDVIFTDDIRFTGFLKHLYGIILGRAFRKALPDVMYNFKKLISENNG
ncbi:MAG: SRPBCC family protein [Cyclobacteriaceae bacterium]